MAELYPHSKNFYMTLDECGQEVPLNSIVCLDGDRWHTVIFCKSGNNPNDFTIISVEGAAATEDIATRADENCIKNMEVTGLVPGTINWTVKYPAGENDLLDYLSCTDCATPVFTPDAFTPPTIIYEVCGQVEGTYRCEDGEPMMDCAELRVTTLEPIKVNLDVDLTTICTDDIPEINAEITPTNLTYQYRWYDGPDATGNVVSSSSVYQPPAIGTYSLEVTDISSGVGCNIQITNFNITFDEEGPILLVPPDSPLIVECDDPDKELIIANWLNTVYAYDEDVSSIEVFNDYTSVNATCNLDQWVHFRAYDICGNETLDSALIQFIDLTIPVINPASPASSDCSTSDPNNDSGFIAWLANHGGATATDECDDDLEWIDNSDIRTWGGTPANQQITITFTVTDDCGNTAQTTATYSIIDDEPPTITCPADVEETALLNDCDKILEALTDPVMADNCSVPAVSYYEH